MRKLTKHELEKRSILRDATAAIRRKHTRHADAEINERIPALDAEIDEALLSGKPFSFKVSSLYDEG